MVEALKREIGWRQNIERSRAEKPVFGQMIRALKSRIEWVDLRQD